MMDEVDRLNIKKFCSWQFGKIGTQFDTLQMQAYLDMYFCLLQISEEHLY